MGHNAPENSRQGHLVGSVELTIVTIASWNVLLSPKSLTSILDIELNFRLKTASLWQNPFEFQGTCIRLHMVPLTSTKSSLSIT